MLRNDERTAWTGFLTSAPQFAGEQIAVWFDGPDPPDILCTASSGKKIGVELTKWVDENQVRHGKQREKLERCFLSIIRSENRQRLEHIGKVLIRDNARLIATNEADEFARQLFNMLHAENAKSAPSLARRPIPPGYWSTVRTWDTDQGASISDFPLYPMLQKYLDSVWIFPRHRYQHIDADEPWVIFDNQGGPYSRDWMVRALVENVTKKITKYSMNNLRASHTFAELDLLCYYCDEALLHNAPYDQTDSGLTSISIHVGRILRGSPRVFDRIFLYDPHTNIRAIKIG
jgi:hypothetical protein